MGVSKKPLAIDLYAGLGGWAEGFLSEGFDVVGFDIERRPYPAQLVLQDVLTLDGSRFIDAAVIVASPPCQAYSYRAMPWKAAKAKTPEELGLGCPKWWDKSQKEMTECESDEWKAWRQCWPREPPDNTLFDACFRIQREASGAAGRHVPMLVENVRGAQQWVGRAAWHYGSFYLWGDVPALMPIAKAVKVGGARGDDWFTHHNRPEFVTRMQRAAENDGVKAPGLNWSDRSKRGQDFTRVAGARAIKNNGVKQCGDWFGAGEDCSIARRRSSRSDARKHASALIAKIPFPLARHIARCYRPEVAA